MKIKPIYYRNTTIIGRDILDHPDAEYTVKNGISTLCQVNTFPLKPETEQKYLDTSGHAHIPTTDTLPVHEKTRKIRVDQNEWLQQELQKLYVLKTCMMSETRWPGMFGKYI